MAEQTPAGEASAPARGEAAVSVRGIEGSMSSYDVRATMDRRSGELAACQAPRVRVVPVLAGSVEFAIQIDREGRVGDVEVRTSDLGDRTLERCVRDVIMQTPFPAPNGGDARITWTMTLEPERAGMEPELWDHEQVADVVDQHLADLQSECGIAPHGKKLDVTAYVNRRGRVVSAGVMAKSKTAAEDLDCIVAQLSTWPMPKPKQSRFAKVSFKLASAAAPRKADRQHGRKHVTKSSRTRRRR